MSDGIPLDLVVFIVAAFCGAFVAGVAGFAFGLVASAIWLHVITPAQSAPLIAAFAIIIQGTTLWKLRHAIPKARVLRFVIASAIGIPLGSLALAWATRAQMRVLIGLLLILFSLYSLARPSLPAVGDGRFREALVGVASGLFAGSTGLAGIPVILWSALRRWSKDEQRAVFQPVAVSTFALTLLWVAGTGGVTESTIRLFLAGLPAVLLGTWLGFRLYGMLNEAIFRAIVLALLLLSGLALLPWR
jgi:uncharacterized membrane protein YfcA